MFASLIAALLGCRATTDHAHPRGGSVCVAISVDWEGASLEEPDLAALEGLGRALPHVPLTHFLNAAYFTKPDADARAARSAIDRVVRKGDELGLHVHPWHTLVRAAGVEPREGASFLASEALSIDGEPGFDIELETYSSEEIEAMLRKSLELLGLESATTFRAGAWLAGPRIFEAVRRVGFEIDSSAAFPGWFEELADTPLPRRLRETWPELTAVGQPYRISTPAGSLLEMPLTGGMADYATAREIEAYLRAILERAVREDRMLFAQTGVHQEGAGELTGRLLEAITALERTSKERLVFDTVAGCARRMF